jgi:hypothetical protein
MEMKHWNNASHYLLGFLIGFIGLVADLYTVSNLFSSLNNNDGGQFICSGRTDLETRKIFLDQDHNRLVFGGICVTNLTPNDPIICVLVLGANLHVAMAADYFVATTGNDGNRGTIQQPFRTLERGVRALASGDRLLIRGGTYQRGPGHLDVPSGGGSWATATTMAAFNNEKVILTPQDLTDGGTDVIRLPTGKSWIIFDGLILDGLRDGLILDGILHAIGQGGGHYGLLLIYGGHHFRIINTEILKTAGSAILAGKANYNEFIHLKLHHNNHNFSPDHLHNTRRVYGIYMEWNHNRVKGCDVHHNRGYGIVGYSGYAHQPNNNKVIGNNVHHNALTRFVVARGTGNILINNLIYKNGTRKTSGYKGWNRWGLQIGVSTQNSLVYHNTMYENVLGEMWLGGGAQGTEVANEFFQYLLQEEVKNIFRKPKVWPTVTTLANALIKHRELDGDTAWEICENAG